MAAEPRPLQKGYIDVEFAELTRDYQIAAKDPKKQLQLLTAFVGNQVIPRIPVESNAVTEHTGLPIPQDIVEYETIGFLGLGREFIAIKRNDSVAKVPIIELKLRLRGIDIKSKLTTEQYSQYIKEKVTSSRYAYGCSRHCLGSLVVDTNISDEGIVTQPLIEPLPHNSFDVNDELLERERIIRDGYPGKSTIPSIEKLSSIPAAELKKAAVNLIHGVLLGYIPDIHVMQGTDDTPWFFTSLWSSLAGITQDKKIKIFDFGDPLMNHFTVKEREEIEQLIHKNGGIQGTITIGPTGEIIFAEWYQQLCTKILESKNTATQQLTIYSLTKATQYITKSNASLDQTLHDQQVIHDQHYQENPDIWVKLRSQTLALVDTWLQNHKKISVPLNTIFSILGEILDDTRLSIISSPVEFNDSLQASPVYCVSSAANPILMNALTGLFNHQHDILSVGQTITAPPSVFLNALHEGIDLANISHVSNNAMASVFKDALLLIKIAQYQEKNV